MTKLLLIGVPLEVISADDAASITSIVFALPARTVVLSWQSTLDVTPASIDLAFEVAIDLEGPFTPVDSADEGDYVSDAFMRTITTPVAARFGRIVVTNGDESEVTVTVLAKVANP